MAPASESNAHTFTVVTRIQSQSSQRGITFTAEEEHSRCVNQEKFDRRGISKVEMEEVRGRVGEGGGRGTGEWEGRGC